MVFSQGGRQMKNRRVLVTLLLSVLLVLLAVFDKTVNSQGQDPNAQTNQADKVSGTGVTTTDCGSIDCEDADPNSTDNFTFDAGANALPAGSVRYTCDPNCISDTCDGCLSFSEDALEAPAAFDDETNGLIEQGDPIASCSPAPTPGTFAADEFIFGVVDEKGDGLGPVYNAQACRECHQNPVVGGISQTTELRAGHLDGNNNFVDAPGGSLINDRAINSKVQERVPPLFSSLAYPATTPNPAASPSPSPIEGAEDKRAFR